MDILDPASLVNNKGNGNIEFLSEGTLSASATYNDLVSNSLSFVIGQDSVESVSVVRTDEKNLETFMLEEKA